MFNNEGIKLWNTLHRNEQVPLFKYISFFILITLYFILFLVISFNIDNIN